MTAEQDHPPIEPGEVQRPEPEVSAREAYNMASDTVTGVNFRLGDNAIQLVVVVVCAMIGAGVGAVATPSWRVGALIGVVAGMVLGLLGSGLWLMIFRGLRHLRGRHD